MSTAATGVCEICKKLKENLNPTRIFNRNNWESAKQACERCISRQRSAIDRELLAHGNRYSWVQNRQY